MVQDKNIIVVGAGIVGASIAYHLASLGARVTVLEQATPAAGVSRQSFAWINQADESPDASNALRRLALTDYRRLQQALPQLAINWSGALSHTRATLDSEQRCKVAPIGSARWLTRAQISQLEPNLNSPAQRARYARDEGSLDPVAAIRTLLDAACAHGAQVLEHTPVLGLEVEGQQVVGIRTANAVLRADCVVLAAGCASPLLLAPLGINLPVQASPSILLRFDAPPGLVKTLVSNDQLEVREDSDGGLLAAEDYLDADGPRGPQAIAQQALQVLRSALRGAEAISLRSVEVGQRPMPVDRLPIIGHCPGQQGLYLAVMHAGVTLAASVGRLVSEEVVHGQRCVELDACRPERFT
ncbi:FAD-binding oxidoreductase [Pseudomonas sp. PH1b]|uniref:NAD(P)/FAD-dependent oxidoreductase n=1 Tax=Pseudomonas sp. PH1b TaxID=1397282 RepID=UPI00046A4F1F|nr:FAD-dependent oxidoreductase [Pseudomonas sp. PH1b]